LTGRGGFKKGQSGNPGGRPRQLASVMHEARRLLQRRSTTSTPQVLKSSGRQLGIPDRRLNAAVTEISLQRSGIGPLVCQRIAGRMSEHVRMALERQFGLDACPLDQLGQASGREWREYGQSTIPFTIHRVI